MKEIKDFIKELNDCAILSDGGPVVSVSDAIRIVAEAFTAGMNFQDHENKQSTTQY